MPFGGEEKCMYTTIWWWKILPILFFSTIRKKHIHNIWLLFWKILLSSICSTFFINCPNYFVSFGWYHCYWFAPMVLIRHHHLLVFHMQHSNYSASMNYVDRVWWHRVFQLIHHVQSMWTVPIWTLVDRRVRSISAMLVVHSLSLVSWSHVAEPPQSATGYVFHWDIPQIPADHVWLIHVSRYFLCFRNVLKWNHVVSLRANWPPTRQHWPRWMGTLWNLR